MLSYKRGKAYSTMSKVIMGNGGFYGCLNEPHGVSSWGKETTQTHVFVFSRSLLLNRLERQSIITHDANRHCRVSFYTFLVQPLSKQLYATISSFSSKHEFKLKF